MNFKKVGFNFKDINSDTKQDSSKLLPSCSVQNVDYTESPSNPDYWKALSFKGSASHKEENCNCNEIINEYANLRSRFPVDFLKRSLPLFINKATNTIDRETLDMMVKMYFKPYFFENTCNGKITTSCYAPFYKVDLEGMLPYIIEALKDKNGEFNSTNCKYMQDVFKIRDKVLFLEDGKMENFNLLKDENGVIDPKKFKKVTDIYYENLNVNLVLIKRYINFLNKTNDETSEEIINKLIEYTGSKKEALNCSEIYYDTCFDDKGTLNSENISILDNMVKCMGENSHLSYEMFEILNHKKNINTFFDLASKNKNISSKDISSFTDFVKKFNTKEDKLPEVIKKPLINCYSGDLKLCDYLNIFNSLVKKDGDAVKISEKKLKLACEIYKTCDEKLNEKISPSIIADLLNDSSNLNKMPFSDKGMLLDALNIMRSNVQNDNANSAYLDKKIYEVQKSICAKTIALDVDDKNIENFKAKILESNSENAELSAFENIIKESMSKFATMKNGVPLLYDRKNFMNDLSQICNTEEKREMLSSKADIDLILENGKIKGYNGIFTLNNFDRTNDVENQIYEVCHKFFYENKANTGDKNLDDAINDIIDGIPEFINTIGKKQHETQEHSLDIHQLMVLAHSINNPEYKNLSSKDKSFLKIVCLLHDISKKEEIIDEEHQDASSLVANSIVPRFFENENDQDRIFDFIKNHHWLKEYNTSNDKEMTAKKIAFKFRRPNDFKVAKIFAKADLFGVSNNFYNLHKEALDEDNLTLIENKLAEFYSNGSAVFSDYPIDKAKLEKHKEIINGREFKVINLHKIDENEDLSEYGFPKGKTKNDLCMLVHMVDEKTMKNSLNKVNFLTKSINCGVLSQSFIDFYNKRTYMYRKFGVLLANDNANIISVSEINQSSGYKRGEKQALELIFGTEQKENKYNNNYSSEDDSAIIQRRKFKNALFENLHIDANNVSDSEYGTFYKKYLLNINSISQIDKNMQFELGCKKFSGLELKDAINKYQKFVISKADFSNNEIVGYTPKIKAVVAKVENISELPNEFLDFAYENKLPILLI